MFLFLSKEKTIKEIQQDFNSQYPFLKLEFYKKDNVDPDITAKKHFTYDLKLKDLGLSDDGLINIQSDLSIGDLKKIFFKKFGLNAQVSRKSGTLWLETTMTDRWSLQKQDDHGREITLGRFNRQIERAKSSEAINL